MDAKLVQLFDDLVEERLTADEAKALGQRLRADAAAFDEFVDLLHIHLGLSQRAAAVRPFSVEELRAIKAVDDRFDLHLLPELGIVVERRNAAEGREQRTLRRWMTAFAIAATALVAVSLWSLRSGYLRSWQSSAVPLAADGSALFSDGAVARVSRKIDCDWSDDRWAVATSSQITQGQLITLTKGILVLEFQSGAEVTLNGPTTLVATSGKSAKLIKGELSARVPPQAHGFRVETHAGDFVDLGTEFGLLVADNGDVETHVFKGQVVAEPAAMGGQPTDHKLLETGHAWARPVAGAIDTAIVANPQKFLLPLKEDDIARLAAPPVGRSLALWLSADSLVQRDGSDGVSEWGGNVVAGNPRRENAWQVTTEKRPKWIGQSIGGKPALRFDGYKGLVTEPFKLGPSQTSAVVFRVDGDVARELVEDRSEYQELGVQLLNLNGPPHTVVQINGDLSLEARVHLGFVRDQLVPVDVGRVSTAKPIDNNPHVVLYSFDVPNARAQLYLDGRLVAETLDVPTVDATNAPRFIGSHYDREGFGFTGDIAEVMIYGDALAPSDCQSISTWLGDKYGIAVARDKPADRTAMRGN